MRLITAVVLFLFLANNSVSASEASRNQASTNLSALTSSLPTWKRSLPISSEDARLVGEAISREIPLFLTTNEAGRAAKFQLSYQNSISVMPETFRMIVKINDVFIGETVTPNASKAETLSLDIPIGILQAGFNSVRVSVRQSHRVDCSLNSTYELWTQLLTEQSTLVFSGMSGEIKVVQDLPAVNPRRDGAVPIRVKAPSHREAGQLSRVARALQAAVMLGHYTYPKVEIVSELVSKPGLDILVGTTAELAESFGTKVSGVGPRHHIRHNLQTDNVVLIVTGDSEAEVDMALDAFATEAQGFIPQGSSAGIRALKNANGLEVTGDEVVTFADLGLDAEPFRGRLYRQSIKIRMPADLLTADYDRVVIATDAVYASGLLPTNKMLVRVNGAVIADASLSNPNGGIFTKKTFHLPIGTFKPGLNTVDFEVETRTSGDEKCSLEALVDQRERFLLSNTSEVIVPTLGRVGALPNISSVIPGGLALMSRASDLVIYVPNARPEAVEAAMSALAKMASISRSETKARFSFDLVPAGTAHTLAFGAYDDMPESVLRAAGLDSTKIREVWRRPGSRIPEIAEAIPRVKVTSVGLPLDLSPPVAGEPTSREITGSLALSDASQGSKMLKLFDGRESTWLYGYARSALDTASRFVDKVVAQINALWPGHREPLPLDESGTLVVAQGAKIDHLGDWGTKLIPDVSSTTVFVAPSPEELSRAVSEILSGSLWQQFVGDTAVYSARDGAVRTRVSQQILLIPTESLNLQNIRLIAAGWLSRNIAIYLGALLGIVFVMTVFMQWVLRSSGVREQ